jgi:hypothetical protein
MRCNGTATTCSTRYMCDTPDCPVQLTTEEINNPKDKGCGINDNCQPGEICVDVASTLGFQCKDFADGCCVLEWLDISLSVLWPFCLQGKPFELLLLLFLLFLLLLLRVQRLCLGPPMKGEVVNPLETTA